MVNRHGFRFVDEGEEANRYTYAKFVRAILAQPGAKAWQIFDQKVIHLLEPRYSTSRPLIADTSDERVEQLDIEDKQQAVKTLIVFKAAARGAN
jgi:tricarballylate dehydrogenase